MKASTPARLPSFRYLGANIRGDVHMLICKYCGKEFEAKSKSGRKPSSGYQCDEIPPGVLRFLELPLPNNGADLRASFRKIKKGWCQWGEVENPNRQP